MPIISVNGKEKEVSDNYTVNDILTELQVIGSIFVVEKNLEILPNEEYKSTVANGDKYEVVGLFGGG